MSCCAYQRHSEPRPVQWLKVPSQSRQSTPTAPSLWTKALSTSKSAFAVSFPSNSLPCQGERMTSAAC
ncbi:TPA: hypothetical protein N0F65_003229 [Lagenidium giganteum]|uniref:Uncharacterized protein n=1 Tax=Lagenidium giganteum TaxID=4803 RepID=A0AAV2Z6Q9_9STRA|nr:TPA: hypothetical protein N0F65_003229 [Lagenidium giganteum]